MIAEFEILSSSSNFIADLNYRFFVVDKKKKSPICASFAWVSLNPYWILDLKKVLSQLERSPWSSRAKGLGCMGKQQTELGVDVSGWKSKGGNC